MKKCLLMDYPTSYIENLQLIEDGVKNCMTTFCSRYLTRMQRQSMNSYKQNRTSKKNFEQEAYIKERRAELEEFQDAMKTFQNVSFEKSS